MSRATLAQLTTLGLDSYAIGQMQPSQLQPCLDSASARIDSALATQFALPIQQPYPMDIIECECVLASWTALMVRGYNPATNVDDNIRKRYEYWLDYLDKVSKGELVPQVVEAAVASDAGVTGPSVITGTQRGWSERGISPSVPPHVSTDPFSGD